MKLKKWAILFLCSLMLVSVFSGCGTAGGPTESTPESTAAPKSSVLNVGFGRADITPTEPAPLSGYGNAETTRIWTEIKDRLYASCIAFTDEFGNTILMYSIDNLCVSEAMLFGASAVSKETGVPYENIIIGTTHSHSAPSGSSNHLGSQAYGKQMKQWMMEAAKQALADRKPATMHITTTKPEGINFIRHYIMSDGTYAGDNFGITAGKTYAGHVREVDNTLQLVKFVREGAKDIIMMNWQGHPTGHSGTSTKVLSYSGRITDTVEAGLDCHCLYVLGASGNVNNNSRIKSENAFSNYEEKAAGLAQYVIDADSTYQQIEIGNVQVMAQNVTCESKGGGTAIMPIDAYAIGDFGLVGAPYEMYCENGQAIKAGSPFKMTFVSTCTNMRAGSYIPSISTYDYNNMPHEVYGIQSTSYAKGTAELLQDSFISMLKELYKTK